MYFFGVPQSKRAHVELQMMLPTFAVIIIALRFKNFNERLKERESPFYVMGPAGRIEFVRE